MYQHMRPPPYLCLLSQNHRIPTSNNGEDKDNDDDNEKKNAGSGDGNDKGA